MKRAVDVNKQDIDQIEKEVFPDICRVLLKGFRDHLERRQWKQIRIGSFDDESVHTIEGDEFEIILHEADDIPLDDLCAIGSLHPCYLLSYMDKGLIRMRYVWVDPGLVKVKRSSKLATTAKASSSSSFWTTRRVFVLLLLVMLITAFRSKLWSLASSRWQQEK